METSGITAHLEPWNKGKIVDQKTHFNLKVIWTLRVCLQMVSVRRTHIAGRWPGK